MSTESAPRKRLDALTGLRFLAAFHVVVFHTALWERWPVPESLRHVAGAGYVAVGLFFMLSGFVLTYTYCRNGPTHVPPVAFYEARFARIYPVYALALLVAAPFVLREHLSTGSLPRLVVEGVAVVALVQSWHPYLAMAWNPPGWSLSVEAFFYATFPLLAPRLVGLSVRRTLALMAICQGLLLACALGYISGSPQGLTADHNTEGTWLEVLRYHPLVRLPEFLLGIGLGHLYAQESVRTAVARHSTLLATGAAAAIVGVLALGTSVVPYVLLHNGVLALPFAVLLLALAAGEGAPTRMLSASWLVRLGEASYSLYILHSPLHMVSRSVAGRVFGREVLETPAFVVGFLVFAVVASVVSYQLVEVPLNKRLRRAFESARERRQGVAPTGG
jgi:peptidoglycan/LPS O-acetylase OafA/YrhL